jgi:hypothetical protein
MASAKANRSDSVLHRRINKRAGGEKIFTKGRCPPST